MISIERSSKDGEIEVTVWGIPGIEVDKTIGLEVKRGRMGRILNVDISGGKNVINAGKLSITIATNIQ